MSSKNGILNRNFGSEKTYCCILIHFVCVLHAGLWLSGEVCSLVSG